jgi:hypothetical protein
LYGEKVDTERENMAFMETNKGRELIAIGLRRQGGEWIGNTQSDSDPRAQKSSEKLSITIPTSSLTISTSAKIPVYLTHLKLSIIIPRISITILTSLTIIPKTLD